MTSDAPLATIPSALNLSDIDTTLGTEPRIRDLRLAEVLGMADVHAIRRLIRRHRLVLQSLGEMVSDLDRKPSTGGRPSSSYYLTKRQALFLTAKSDTPRAAMVTVEMVEVFDRFMAAGCVPAVTDPDGRPLVLSASEIAAAMAFRRALHQQMDGEIARLRRVVGAAVSASLDRAILGEIEARGVSP